MAKKIITKPPQDENEKGLSRRAFFTQGAAAAGVGAAAVLAGTPAKAAQDEGSGITWDYEADIVIIGAGCTGLPAAIRGRDLGATVLRRRPEL